MKDVPLLNTICKPYGAESFDWLNKIINNRMPIGNGYVYPRQGNGWGFRFREEFLEEVK